MYSCTYRTFEILATRSFQISSSNPFLEDTFKNGGLVTYQDLDDLFDNVEYYIKHPKEREYHARLGYNIAMENTYEKKFPLFHVDDYEWPDLR